MAIYDPRGQLARSYWWGPDAPEQYTPERWRCGTVDGYSAPIGQIAFDIARCPLSDVLCGCDKGRCLLAVGGDYPKVRWRAVLGTRFVSLN